MDARVDSVTVNGRRYARPQQPVVVVCVDGCEPDYVTQAIQAGVAPYLKRMVEKGASVVGDCVVLVGGATVHSGMARFTSQ